MYDRNRFAKFLIYLFVAFWAAYLVLIGVSLPFVFEKGFPGMEPYDVLNACLPGILFLISGTFPFPDSYAGNQTLSLVAGQETTTD